MADDIAREMDVSVWEALLWGVRLAAGRVAWTQGQLSNAVRRSDGDMDAPAVRTWMAESRRERLLMTRTAKAAVDAGVAERLVRQVEMSGRLVALAVEAALDSLPQLSPEDRYSALSAAQASLFKIEEEEQGRPRGIGST